MLTAIVRFEEDAAGLEKTLRLLQSLCTVAIGIYGPAAAMAGEPEALEALVRMRGHFMLGRRYFRLLKWHPCWTAASAALLREQATGRRLIEVLKWTFLGAYFFLEMFTITNALGVTNYAWCPRMQLEANKCWFYAIVLSMLLSAHDLLAARSQPSPHPGMQKHVTKQAARAPSAIKSAPTDQTNRATSQAKLYTQLVIDMCDLSTPGSAVGWLPVGAVVVGICGVVSSILAARQIWLRTQSLR